MIKHNNNSFSSVYDATTEIGKIMKGTLLLYESWKELFASGVPPITLQKCKGVDLVDYKIYGNSVQNGTPTPETPIEVESVGEKTKNLIPEWKEGWIIPDNGVLSVTYPNRKYTDYIPIESNKSYYVSGGGTYSNWTLYDENYNFLEGQIFNSSRHIKYSLAKYVRIAHPNSNVGNIQLEEGTEATEYEPYGYRIPVKVSGKNLLNINEYFSDYITSSNEISFNYTNFRNIYLKKLLQGKFEENTQYTISFDYEITNSSGNGIFVYCTYTDGTGQSQYFDTKWKTTSQVTGSQSGTVNFTSKADATINTIAISYSYADKSCDVKLKNMQIEKGTSATSYEPYQEPITTTIYLDEPLRKIGDYADYIDFENGKVVRNIKRVYANNKISYRYDMANGAVFNGEWAVFQFNVALKDTSLAYSNTFKQHNSYAKADYVFWLQTGKTYLSFNLKKTDIGATSDNTNTEIQTLGRAYVVNNPIYFDIIVEPTEETIELPNIPTFKGTTIIEVDTTINPSNMDVEYWGKGKLQTLNEEDNVVLNEIIATNTITQLDITNTEINEILDEIIGG